MVVPAPGRFQLDTVNSMSPPCTWSGRTARIGLTPPNWPKRSRNSRSVPRISPTWWQEVPYRAAGASRRPQRPKNRQRRSTPFRGPIRRRSGRFQGVWAKNRKQRTGREARRSAPRRPPDGPSSCRDPRSGPACIPAARFVGNPAKALDAAAPLPGPGRPAARPGPGPPAAPSVRFQETSTDVPGRDPPPVLVSGDANNRLAGPHRPRTPRPCAGIIRGPVPSNRRKSRQARIHIRRIRTECVPVR